MLKLGSEQWCHYKTYYESNLIFLLIGDVIVLVIK